MFTRRKKVVDVTAPTSGRVIHLDEVPDPVFARRSLGDGCAVMPSSGEFTSPCDGEVIMVAPTGHAFAIRSREGAELLVHIGIDTVRLRGDGFILHHRVGDRLSRGEVVVSADLERLQEVAPSLASPLVVTNGDAFEITETITGDTVDGVVMRLRAR